jgi:hypothetical protein
LGARGPAEGRARRGAGRKTATISLQDARRAHATSSLRPVRLPRARCGGAGRPGATHRHHASIRAHRPELFNVAEKLIEDTFAEINDVKCLTGRPGRTRDLGMQGVFSDGLGAANVGFCIVWSVWAVAGPVSR